MFKASVAAMLHAPLDCITCLSLAQEASKPASTVLPGPNCCNHLDPTSLAMAAQCMVCQDVLQDGTLIESLPCAHQFHNLCITSWGESKGGHFHDAPCPVCKTVPSAADRAAPADVEQGPVDPVNEEIMAFLESGAAWGGDARLDAAPVEDLDAAPGWPFLSLDAAPTLVGEAIASLDAAAPVDAPVDAAPVDAPVDAPVGAAPVEDLDAPAPVDAPSLDDGSDGDADDVRVGPLGMGIRHWGSPEHGGSDEDPDEQPLIPSVLGLLGAQGNGKAKGKDNGKAKGKANRQRQMAKGAATANAAKGKGAAKTKPKAKARRQRPGQADATPVDADAVNAPAVDADAVGAHPLPACYPVNAPAVEVAPPMGAGAPSGAGASTGAGGDEGILVVDEAPVHCYFCGKVALWLRASW